jgi:D-sedoheptulose 7-phosphate isomerase
MMAELSERVNVSLLAQENYLNLHLPVLTRAGASLGAALERGNKLLALGCPTVAQHMVAELTGRFVLERPALPAICLSENNSAVTAILNDYGRSSVYVRQLIALAQDGDFVLGLLAGVDQAAQEGIEQAQRMGLETLVLEFSRESGGGPRLDGAGVEEWTATEAFLTAAHLLCEEAEAELRRLQPDRFPAASSRRSAPFDSPAPSRRGPPPDSPAVKL